MFLSEEFGEASWHFPVHKAAFSSVMDTALDGKSIWAENYGNHKVTQADVERASTLMNSANYVYNDNTVIIEIVLEQAEKYFSGYITAQEAADSMQSKVCLYLHEQM